MIDRYSLSTYSDMRREIFLKIKNTKVSVLIHHRENSSNIEKEKNVFMKDRMQEKT